jgi:lipopolysaccharide biosynthesis protein
MQNVCLFAHFDRHDKVSEHVLRYLREIKELQFSVVFISTARLSNVEIERLRADCSDVILRENEGLDFGSWSLGFSKHEAQITGRLLLANDSVYGPIGGLAAAFDKLAATPADFYGFVESVECEPHLQSWFMLFEHHIVQSSQFKAILRQPFFRMTKTEIILNGELGLSQALIRAGFKYNALYRPSQSSLAERFCPINPTHVFWRELLLYEEIPFLKIELLRDNPMYLEDSETILSMVETLDPSLYCLIKDHLAQSSSRCEKRRNRSIVRRLANTIRLNLMRRGYRLWRAHQRFAELWNFALLLVIVTLWRIFRSPSHFAG